MTCSNNSLANKLRAPRVSCISTNLHVCYCKIQKCGMYKRLHTLSWTSAILVVSSQTCIRRCWIWKHISCYSQHLCQNTHKNTPHAELQQKYKPNQTCGNSNIPHMRSAWGGWLPLPCQTRGHRILPPNPTLHSCHQIPQWTGDPIPTLGSLYLLIKPSAQTPTIEKKSMESLAEFTSSERTYPWGRKEREWTAAVFGKRSREDDALRFLARPHWSDLEPVWRRRGSSLPPEAMRVWVQASPSP